MGESPAGIDRFEQHGIQPQEPPGRDQSVPIGRLNRKACDQVPGSHSRSGRPAHGHYPAGAVAGAQEPAQEHRTAADRRFCGAGIGRVDFCDQRREVGGSDGFADHPALTNGSPAGVPPAAQRAEAGPKRADFVWARHPRVFLRRPPGGSAGPLYGVVHPHRRLLPPAGADWRLCPPGCVYSADAGVVRDGPNCKRSSFCSSPVLWCCCPWCFKTVADVPSAYLDVARTKGATQWQQVTRVLFPIARADIWDHLRAVYGVGWGWIIMAEVVNAENGLGYMMDRRERRGTHDSIFAIVVVIISSPSSAIKSGNTPASGSSPIASGNRIGPSDTAFPI